jgi:adenine-specific DNA-methyltransferase
MKISPNWNETNEVTLVSTDCVKLLASLPDASVNLTITSPPYCMGKVYEDERNAADFEKNHAEILPEIVRVTKLGGSICWQVGYHVSDGVVTPLDFVVYQLLQRFPDIRLRNRIIWTFGHGLHTSSRFSGRHETILWFTKGDQYTFNLNDVRVPQKYPGKKGYKGSKKGKLSGNPLGKNPSDIWEIPNVKAQHVEKTEHPCQFPVVLALRMINALSNPGDLVLDPYLGAGTTGVAAVIAERRFAGSELNKRFFKIAKQRIESARAGTLRYRLDEPVYEPKPNTSLTSVPEGWHQHKLNEIIPMSPPKTGQISNGPVFDLREGTLRAG